MRNTPPPLTRQESVLAQRQVASERGSQDLSEQERRGSTASTSGHSPQAPYTARRRRSLAELRTVYTTGVVEGNGLNAQYDDMVHLLAAEVRGASRTLGAPLLGRVAGRAAMVTREGGAGARGETDGVSWGGLGGCCSGRARTA